MRLARRRRPRGPSGRCQPARLATSLDSPLPGGGGSTYMSQEQDSGSQSRRRWTISAILVATVLGVGVALAAWKQSSIDGTNAAAANQPEPIESVAAATARERAHSRTTTSIGTVVALRSITVRNELPGTVRRVQLTPGQIVEAGTVLVGLDVSVEEAELQALQAQSALAE